MKMHPLQTFSTVEVMAFNQKVRGLQNGDSGGDAQWMKVRMLKHLGKEDRKIELSKKKKKEFKLIQ